jgi:integrase/recombinase XerC
MDNTEARECFKQYLFRRYGDRSTPKHYLSDLRIFLNQLGEKPLRDVSMRDIDGFIGQQRGQEMAPTTINRRSATIQTFFECMAAQDLNQVWSNPVNWRRHRVKVGYPLPRDASDLEVKRLFAVINDARDAAMFALMVGAGLRVGEVAQLRLSDLKTPQASEQLVQLRVCGKGNKERLVWLTPLWYGKITAWLAIRPVTDDETSS